MRKLPYEELLEQRLKPEELLHTARHPVSVLLTNVRSLYNVGSIFRSADAARIEELILCGFTPHPPRKEIEKTALGAVDTVPHRYYRHEHEALEDLRSQGKRLIAVELTDTARVYDSWSLDLFPCCLILGNELVGVSDEVLRQCDDSIMIPMYGVKHSLNVSVAAGIVMFEAVRQWHLLQP